MSATPETLAVARQWVAKAEHDLTNARHTLTLHHDCPFDTVCFHAHQCAEKYLKALLTLHGRPFPRTHDLTQLASLAEHVGRLTVPPEHWQNLNPYGVEARYPGLSEPEDRAEADAALQMAQTVRDAIRLHLPDAVLGVAD